MAHTAARHDRGIRPELIAPRGAVPVGVHSDGRTIYEQERFDIKATVDSKTQVIDPATGKKKWRKHPTTGESLYPVMKTKAVYSTVRFVLDRSPRGKVTINPFFEGCGHWLLSDLTTMRGSRDEADIAEASVHIEVPVDEESY